MASLIFKSVRLDIKYTKCASRCGYKHTPTQTDTDSCLDLDGQPCKSVVLEVIFSHSTAILMTVKHLLPQSAI